MALPLSTCVLLLFNVLPCVPALSFNYPGIKSNIQNSKTILYGVDNNKREQLESDSENDRQLHISTSTCFNRRDAMLKTASATAFFSGALKPSTVNAAPSSSAKPGPLVRAPSSNPNSNSNNNNNSNNVSVPRIGYSMYKTDPAQVEWCVSRALSAGTRHFDVGTSYGSNAQVGQTLHLYVTQGIVREDAYFLARGDAPVTAGRNKNNTSSVSSSTSSTGAAPYFRDDDGRQTKQRRRELFVSHKVSNQEQSTVKEDVKVRVREQLNELQVTYLDLCSVHSPLTDQATRLATYEALLDLKDAGFVRSVGVCNYGVVPLDEITSAGLPPPSVIQLELSPFNQHKDVVQWAQKNGSILSCAAWSKLSGASGPQEGWDAVVKIAELKGVTKQQILIRWALQKGYICVPRSGVDSNLQQNSIAENSYKGVNGFILTDDDLGKLDALDTEFKAGKLGRRDGWGDGDVKGVDWDPTTCVV